MYLCTRFLITKTRFIMKQLSSYSAHSNSSRTHALPARTHAHNTRIALYAAFLFLGVLCCANAWGTTTYKLTEVTSVSAGNQYVFVEDGYALTTPSSSVIQSTNSYLSRSLSGSEDYVWLLETSTNGFYIQNCSTSKYLNNGSNTTNMTQSNSGSAEWTFEFTDGKAKIIKYNDDGRYIGEESDNSHTYKAYKSGTHAYAITVYELEEEPDCASKYSFHYGTSGSSDPWTVDCFTKVGSTNEWQITDFTIPETDHFYVGYGGTTNGQSITKAWSDAPSKDGVWQGQMHLVPYNTTSNDVNNWGVGHATGATGTLNMYDNSSDKNQFVGFIPDGYGIVFGGNSYAFGEATDHVRETELVTLPADLSTTYYIGLQTATEGTYVKCGHSETTDQALSTMGHTSLEDGLRKIWCYSTADNWIGSSANMAIWDATNSHWGDNTAEHKFMTKVNDNLWYGYVPTNATTLILVRVNPTNDAPAWDWGQSYDITPNDVNNYITITGGYSNSKFEYTIGSYHPSASQKGKFRMWDNNSLKNWCTHWIPYNVLSYDANGGTGTTSPSSINTETTTPTVTVASNGFTRTGYTLAGWATSDVRADEGTVDYAPGDTYTLTSDATLYAVWSPIPVSSLALTVQQTDQSDKVGNDLTMNCYPKEGQSGGNDPLNHTLKVNFTEVLPANALDKEVDWSVRVKANGDADWTDVGFSSNSLNTNSIINSYNKNTGNLQIKATEGTAEIKITAHDGSGVTAKVTITVTNVALSSLNVAKSSTTLYVGESEEIAVTYDPVNTTTKGYTTGSYTYVTVSRAYDKITLTGKAATSEAERVTLTSSDAGAKTATIDVTVKPLPTVTFVDLIHNKTDFENSGDGWTAGTGVLSSTASAGVVSHTKATPTHDDLDEPGTGNDCEKAHLHLVGWIRSDYSKVVAYLNGTGDPLDNDDFTDAGTGYWFTPDVSINVETYNGKMFYAVWEEDDGNTYAFSCADLQLDEPANDADNVLSNVIYVTSTSGQKVRSAAHFRVHGDGLTPSQTITFTTGDADLDELYTFRKADGTAVATDASGEVDAEVYIFYQPTATSDGRDVATSLTASVARKGDGSGKPATVVNSARSINGRHLPSQFIIAAKAGDYWYALPADMLSSSAHAGYSFTPNNATTPTEATVAPEAALYNLYGYATSAGVCDSSFVRLAGDNNHKTLWSNKSNSSVGIRDYATISASSPKGDQYEWRLTNTGADTYNLWNPAANLTGRNLGLKELDKKWNMYADGSGIVKELRILPVVSISAYITLLGEDWEESAFTYTKVSGDIPSHHHVQVTYNGDTYTATESGTTITITDADFAEAGGFTAAPGTQLTLEWCSEGGDVVAQGSLFTPIFITSNTTNLDAYEAEALAGTDIFVTNGAKLTVSKNITVHDVTVNSGATLFIDKADESTGVTLTLSSGKLVLRGGWTTINGDPSYNMPRVYIDPLSSLAKTNTTINLYLDIYKAEEGLHYYPFAVPFPVAVKDIDYVDPYLAGFSTYGTHYAIKRYNGARRADYGAIDENWELVPLKDEEADVYLQPGEGYIILALAVGGKAQLVVPMKNVANGWTTLGEQATYSDKTRNIIAVTHHEGAATAGGGANKRHEGWNMLANPFMSCFATNGNTTHSETDGFIKGHFTITGDPADPYGWTEKDDNIYVSVPTHDFSEYIQKEITEAELLPGWSFFIQAAKNGNVTFAVTGQQTDSDLPIYAPKRKEAENMPTVKTGIVLSSETASDKTTFLISDKYSDEYEIGADLEKMFGNGYTLATYSLNNDTRLAFNAMSTNDAKSVIPVGIRIPADGSYTFSLNERYADADIERIDLIDYETNTVTNLTAEDYTFNATRSQNDERFAINITPRAQTPTDIGDTGIDDTNGVRKILLNETIYIIRDGRVYDATGKRVTTINK